MRWKKLLTLLLASLLAGPDLVWVATVDGMGISPVHVSNVLRCHGISALTGGSIAYGVNVSAEDVDHASRIIRADAHDKPYHYGSVIGGQSVGLPESESWEAIVVIAKLNEIDRFPALRNDRNLRGLARKALIEVGRMFEELPSDLYVSSIRAFRMDYMADDLRLRAGYAAEVKVASIAEPSRTATAIGWAWDDGRRVEFRTMFGDL
ncbi:MAG: hypothetical protein M3R13_07620 [Armatimonadota bacterium]|nr:hypothetical protein [Armatimonadota bacterium]